MANIAIAAPAIIPATPPLSRVAFTGWAVVDVDMDGSLSLGPPTLDEPQRNPPATASLPSGFIRK